ncbi:hypothetical protein CONCODRAFT_76655 [Conidiobolus coronatus NRRL 28638]|uniref:Uncharacterized protein n=1 Tax=Conidiobolus coronatus (strain ATCC 28846 / CBS 209.66 / NRRL 28638) TaxID=796925 RepID=A0A137PID2_CONC2|nr:hypothetical protein CONCODRAFT_76655 [Conidiobolus coronatus NRRL 28638]|eukprot:KXN74757.1 hypothetical protein CONCODRAFT_76655 [Conidiobolus coronatus NRRL 28638]
MNTESFENYVSTIKSEECSRLLNQAFICRQRRSPSPKAYASTSNHRSCSSIESATTSASVAMPYPLEFTTAIHQKGYEQRQYENSEKFDKVVELGFDSDPNCPTLHLTLTPMLLRGH